MERIKGEVMALFSITMRLVVGAAMLVLLPWPVFVVVVVGWIWLEGKAN